MIQQNKFIKLGYIKSACGIKGWVKVKSYTNPEINITNYQNWSLKKEKNLSCATVASAKQQGKSIIVKLSGCDDRDQALLYVGSEILIPKELLPELEDYIYWHQLEGISVYHKTVADNNLLGIINHMIDTSANDVAVVIPTKQSIDDKERLIPWVIGNVITEVNTEQGFIIVDWDPSF